MKNFSFLIVIVFLIPFIDFNVSGQEYKIIDHNHTDLHAIPDEWIDAAQENLHIKYFRASHGSQLTNGGMTAIVNYSSAYAEKFNFNENDIDGALHIEEEVADLEHQNAEWVSMTESYLAANPECNVIMWAWCDIYEMNVTQYLADMEYLEAKYGEGGSANRPVPVTFVYMNGHSWPYNASGRGEWVFNANQQIRAYCHANNKWFYDFTDIESYDPDENYFGDGYPDGTFSGEHHLRWDCSYDIDEYSRGNWGIEWMNANPAAEISLMAADYNCTSCEHSTGDGGDDNSRLHCVLKGNAAWQLWARLAGWGNEVIPVTDINVSAEGDVTEVALPSETLQLYAEILPADASDKSVSWSVINGTGQASVSVSGLVTPVAEGTVTVRATAQDGSEMYGEIALTIVDETVLVTDINVSSEGGATEVAIPSETLQLYAEVLPADATNKSVSWSVINGTGQATVSTSGLVTPVEEGSITVRAKAQDGTDIYGEIAITIVDETVLVSEINVTSEDDETEITLPAGTLQLYAEVIPVDATNTSISWSVINSTGEATISGSGLVTAVSEGSVTAKASAQDGSGIYGELELSIIDGTILVNDINVTSQDGETEIPLPSGSLQLYAEVFPLDATNKTVSWSITDGTGEAEISSSGLITPVSVGTVTARATAQDGSGVYGEIALSVYDATVFVSDINISSEGSGTEVTLPLGSLQLYAEVLPANASNKNVTWSIINGTGEAEISSSGLVTPVGVGTVTARATAQDGSGVYSEIDLTVIDSEIEVTEINITSENNKTEVALPSGTLQLFAEVIPSNASNKSITWTVICGTGEATVSQDGIVTAVREGSLVVWAESNDGTGITDQLELVVIEEQIMVTEILVTAENDAHEITVSNGTLQLYAEILPEEASNKDFLWDMENASGSATITETGLVQAISDGMVYAKATAIDGSDAFGYIVLRISGQESPTGIDIFEVSRVTITPEYLSIDSDFSEWQIKQVRFVDLKGRIQKIENVEPGQNLIYFNELPQGIYVVQFITGNRLENIKIFKP